MSLRPSEENLSLIHAFEKKLEENPEQDLSKVHVVVPTLRLATHLLAFLAVKRKACILPKIQPIEAYLLDLSFNWGFEPALLSASELEVLISRIFSDERPAYRPGQIHEITQLFVEIERAGRGVECFSQLEEYLETDVFRGDFKRSQMFNRTKSLAKGFEKFQQILRKNNWAIRDQALLFASQHFFASTKIDSESLKKHLGNCDQLYIFGLSSVSPTSHAFLIGAASLSWVHYILSPPPLLTGSTSEPLFEIWKLLSQTPPTRITSQKNHVKIVAADHRSDFANIVLNLTRRFVAEGGELHSLGVLLASENLDAPAIKEKLDAHDIPYNSASAKTVSQTSIGIWCEKILGLCSKEAELHDVFAFLLDDNTFAYLFAKNFIDLEFREVIAEIYSSLAKIKIGGGFNTFSNYVDYLSQKKDISESLKRFHLSLQKFSENFTPNDSLKMLQIVLEESTCFSHLRSINPNQHEQVEKHWKNFLELGERLGFTEDYEDLKTPEAIRKHFLSQAVFELGEPLHGVQLLSIAEARSYPFHTVIIVGCHEGEFPIAYPNDELLSSLEKSKMGLPTWDELESRENQTFELLCNESQSVFLIASHLQNGRELVASRFIAKSLIQGAQKIKVLDDIQISSAPSCSHLLFPKALIPAQADFIHSTLSTSRFSASKVERYVRCSYRFLSQETIGSKLKLAKKAEVNLQKEGEILHEIVALTLKNLEAIKFEKKIRQEEIAALIFQELIKVTALVHQPPSKSQGLSLLVIQHLKDFSWPKLSDFLAQIFYNALAHDAQFPHNYPEYSLSQGKTFLGPFPNQYEVNGAIDLLMDFPNFDLIIDFKRRGVPKKSDSLYSPQLLFYSEVRQQKSPSDLKPVHCGYWSLLNGTWLGITGDPSDKIQQVMATTFSPSGSKKNDLQDRIEQLKSVIKWRTSLIHSSSSFQADPSFCGFCDKAQLCRKDEITVKPFLLPLLEKHLKASSKKGAL